MCIQCDVTMSGPPHVCLRWLTLIGDEGGWTPAFAGLDEDHETSWRLDRLDGPAHERAES
jgi:hypothetical protein